MKTLKRLSILTVTILLMIGVTGCMDLRTSNEKIKDELLAYLSQKYNGQEFVFVGMENTGYFGNGTTVLHCYPKGGDPETDKVWVETWENEVDGKVIKDNYFWLIVREDVEAEVIAALSGLPLPMKVYNSGIGTVDNALDGSKTYDDLKREEPFFDITVVVSMDGTNKSEKEEYANQIFDKIEPNGCRWGIDVCFFPSEAFEKVQRALTNRNELAEQYRDEYATFSKIIK